MGNKHIPNTWNAVSRNGSWFIESPDGKIIATLDKSPEAEKNAKLIATSPYMLEALQGVAELIGDEDLPDNGEFSGAAISDMVIGAIAIAKGNKN